MNLSSLNKKQLISIYDKISDKQSLLCNEMIAAGRGRENFQQTIQKSKLPDCDDLTRRFAENACKLQEIVLEKESRMKYHGNLKKIRGN